MKHTPGPWNIQDLTKTWNGKEGDWHGGFRLAASDNCCLGIIGHVDARYKHQAKANAHLIAAAPEILEALKEITQHAFDDDTPNEHIREDFERMRDIAFDAIAKAEGTD